jgi:5-methylcytosine-specific restriction endonuclease McrA
MAKLPWRKFFPADWLSDPALSMCSAATRGVWMDLLCAMYSSNGYEVCGTVEQLARLSRCTSGDMQNAIDELRATKTAEVTLRDKNNTDVTPPKITIVSRRLKRETRDREGAAERQRKLREHGGGDPDRWAAIRYEILQRDKKTCAYCGRSANTVDHITPKSRGGDESPDNLVACCKRCNMLKGNKTPEEAGLTFWRASKNNNADSDIKITPERSEVRSQKSEISISAIGRECANAPSSTDAPAPKKTTASKPARKAFSPPDLDAVLAYGAEIGLGESVCRKFVDHYTGNGWRVGRNPMKDWKATLRNWKLREEEYHGNGKFTGHPKPGRGQYMPTPADIEDRRRRFGLADTPGDG